MGQSMARMSLLGILAAAGGLRVRVGGGARWSSIERDRRVRYGAATQDCRMPNQISL